MFALREHPRVRAAQRDEACTIEQNRVELEELDGLLFERCRPLDRLSRMAVGLDKRRQLVALFEVTIPARLVDRDFAPDLLKDHRSDRPCIAVDGGA